MPTATVILSIDFKLWSAAFTFRLSFLFEYQDSAVYLQKVDRSRDFSRHLELRKGNVL